jgi:hypothetical protein
MSILIQTIGQENIGSEFAEILYTDHEIPHFSKEVKNIITQEYHKKLDVAISRILNEISFDQVANNLENILALQGICDPFYYHVIINSTDWSRCQSMTSYKLTKVIHKALLKGFFPLYVSTDKLDQLIRNFFSLPEAIDLGNLNWTDFSEKKDYEYFGMEYDIHKNDFVFFQRRKGIRKPLDEGIAMGLLEGVRLRFPR